MGTSKHLCQATPGGDIFWKKDLDPSVWVYSNSHRSDYRNIGVVADIFNIEISDIIPAIHRNSMSELNVEGVLVPWHLVIRDDVYKKRISTSLETLWHVIDVLNTTGYSDTYVKIAMFLEMLSRASMNVQALERHKRDETNPTILSTLATFEPDPCGLAKRVVYDKTATSTGRLVVDSGPRILTLPTRCRDIVGSRYPHGLPLQVDFISIEPRVALFVNGVEPPRDIYSFIASELFDNKLDRSQVKLATLCALYGVSEHRLRKMLGNEFETRQVITGLKEFFGFNKQVRLLKDELSERGYITNTFGRPIVVDDLNDNIIFNHFIQSSATEASILGFHQLFEMMKRQELDCIPIFLIHDALVIDTNKKFMDSIIKLCHGGIDIPGLGNFPVDIKDLSEC